MPTVTVLAWCLIVSIGAGELLDAGGERGGEVLDDAAGRAHLAVLDLVQRRAASPRWRTAAATRCRTAVLRLEIAVVASRRAAPSRNAVAGSSDRGPSGASRLADGARRARLDRGPASRSGRADASMASAAS